jgi:RsiW-degrading membrane proteinase PrsW (M82 family)
MANLTINLSFSLIIGLAPALIWLWFFLKEDWKHPEPRHMIAKTFIAGMLIVFPVLLLQYLSYNILGITDFSLAKKNMVFVFTLALFEEIGKYVAARPSLLSKYFDEPIDALIYLVTAALGFAAMENIFFLFKTVMDGGIFLGLMTGNMRFLGATLLHSATSSVIGIFIAFSFFKTSRIKVINILAGIIVATLLHAAFNFYIIEKGKEYIFNIFALLWLFVLIIILVFEKVKRIKQINKT